MVLTLNRTVICICERNFCSGNTLLCRTKNKNKKTKQNKTKQNKQTNNRRHNCVAVKYRVYFEKKSNV